MSGHIRRRGARSWELKFDAGRDQAGRRKTRYVSFKGTKREAEAELVKLLDARNNGVAIDPSKLSVADYLRAHLERLQVTPKTAERYKQLAEQQIIPHLGAKILQKLRPLDVQSWHGILLRKGGKDGRPLAPRTVSHAHRVLHRALAEATATELTPRNVSSVVHPPAVEQREVEILSAVQIGQVLAALRGTEWGPLVAVAIGTGLRRGELLGLTWSDFDLNSAALKVSRSVEETKLGLRLKSPKTKAGRRTISLAPSTIETLRAHLCKQRELRMALGIGRETPQTPIFGTPAGELRSPDNLSRDWVRLVKSKGLPDVTFHALRHTHASALIASGVDVVKIARRLGHSSPKVTLTVYAHLFDKGDETAAAAIETALTGA
jgi:integrase